MRKPNIPYVKVYKNGLLQNPITKAKPYLTQNADLGYLLAAQRTAASKGMLSWERIRSKFFIGKTIIKV